MLANRSFTLIPLLLLAGGLSGQDGTPRNLRVNAVRLWSLGDATRVAIEISGEFQFHAERLHNPERVFFDIFRARPWIDGKRLYRNTFDDKLVKGIRVAETLPNVARIVLDLGGDAEFTATQLANPDRLVVELRPASAPPVPQPTSVPAAPPVSQPQSVVAREAHPPVTVPHLPNAEPSKAQTTPANVAAAPPPEPVKPDPAKPLENTKLLVPGKAARHNATGGSSLTRALGLKIARVVLDPGHGGHDEGTVGSRGLKEKDLVLEVALRLGKLIEDRMGSEVIYTRTDDTFVPLEGRTALANEKKADLFLSIHANSSPHPRIGGVETFYLSITNAKDALDVAARENASSQKSVYELRDLVQKIATYDKMEESRDLAARIQTALFANAVRNSPAVKNRGVKKAPFVVLIGAKMPSVLAEVAFLSNSREEAILKRPDGRQKLAEALYRGLSRYAQSLSHFQVAATQGQ